MVTWQKGLIGGILGILILVGTNIGSYILGTKADHPDGPLIINQGKPDPITIIKDPVKPNSRCGKDINIFVEPVKKMIADKYKIKVTAADECKVGVAYFDIDVKAPTYKNSIGFGIGVMFDYSNEMKKIYAMPGITFEYTRLWGQIGFGPSIAYYNAIDNSNLAFKCDLLVHYKW